MRALTLTIVALVLISAFSTNPARAEDELNLTLQSDAAPGYKLTYEEYQIQELERTALRSRNALIGTSAAAAVGLALVIPATSGECNSVEVDGRTSGSAAGQGMRCSE